MRQIKDERERPHDNQLVKEANDYNTNHATIILSGQ